MQPHDDPVSTNITFPHDLWRKAKISAMDRKISLNELTRRAVESYLDGGNLKDAIELRGALVGDSVMSHPDFIAEREAETERIRTQVDAVSGLPIGTRGKGKAELPHLLPRKK
jgi:hypothetical protein